MTTLFIAIAKYIDQLRFERETMLRLKMDSFEQLKKLVTGIIDKEFYGARHRPS